MSLVRRLFFFLAVRNLNLLLRHVPGKLNIDADACSRLQVQRFESNIDSRGQWLPRTDVHPLVWRWL